MASRTEVRMGYARQAQLPDFSLLYAGINTDLAISRPDQSFGTDLGLQKSWIKSPEDTISGPNDRTSSIVPASTFAMYGLPHLGEYSIASFRQSETIACKLD